MFRSVLAGCGAISQKHIDALLDLKDVTEIAAFCDTDIKKAEAKAALAGGRVYSDFDEMLDKEKIDVLHICTPHYLHVPMAKKALERGIAVVCEKPAAISREQFAELKKASENAPLGICFQNRYNESVVRAKALLESGEYGKVKGARGIVTWSRGGDYYTKSPWRGKKVLEGGGVLMNQSIHTLDLMTYLLGRPVKVSAHTANEHLKKVIDEEDTVFAYLTFSDFTAIFFATSANPVDSPIILEIYCENATLRIEGNTLRVKTADGATFDDFTVKTKNGKSVWGTSHEKLIREFYSCLSSGKRFPVGIDSVTDSFDALMAIYDSAERLDETAL